MALGRKGRSYGNMRNTTDIELREDGRHSTSFSRPAKKATSVREFGWKASQRHDGGYDPAPSRRHAPHGCIFTHIARHQPDRAAPRAKRDRAWRAMTAPTPSL